MKSEQPSKSPDLAPNPSDPCSQAAAASPASVASREDFAVEDLRALAQLMQDFSLAELELSRQSGARVRLARAGGVVAAPAMLPAVQVAAPSHPAPAAAPATPAVSATTNVHVITAPLVGTFYRSPSPDAASFAEVGQRVRKGQTLCIIEAMKLMNELESEVDGVIVAILADNGRPVEFGQPLFHIQKG
ncbi:MAG: acetyl-CoA carboxylase biotin carboxyl carrier protein [Myxococcales bacterium]|nr:acetyl-CoA carboxylase biotin carboxyl carrier protein [Myxococcales bacterium]